ncbi:GNAT family N-acetyltransferase [Reyranella sp. MMS21-HV4-11]|uniref:GNAT family N-acetyltransferase n=1 Tax=Reyranella humidisoli TaxID=2849149 RepID=A0ABS6IK01_9HYPH|nr:GNAT family N-acetyltransferase [Reyranella sp. MMS21-HV4-11]MBU8874765.1 GNAT family N-acetyltransferase [Reyranella sp. MMS21-HV4-11]
MIRPCTVAELEAAPTFADMLAEYAAESAIEGMPPPSARMETYHALSDMGALHVLAAWAGDTLAGFITVLAAPLPHYGRTVAVSESFFVAKAHRSTGAGLKLLHAAEDRARELGSPGLLVSAPFEGDLFKVLPRVGYAETNRVFFKKVSHE